MTRPIAPALLVMLAATTAQAQIPPRLPDVNQRSGLITRHIPIVPHLPGDPDRDNWYDTFWEDDAQAKYDHPNSCKHGGLYGLRLKDACSTCFSPYYQGYPGRNPSSDCCRPIHRGTRLISNLVHPWRPVCYYYAGGCYVPVYDLDPLVTGPGPFPIPVFKKPHEGG